MKKLTFFVYHKEYHEFLQQMQELGVVHVQTSAEGTVPAGSELAEKLERCKHLRTLISQLESLAKNPKGGFVGQPEELIERIDCINDAVKPTLVQIQRAVADVEALKPWGDFDRQAIKGLADRGYEFHFFKCLKKQLEDGLITNEQYYKKVKSLKTKQIW